MIGGLNKKGEYSPSFCRACAAGLRLSEYSNYMTYEMKRILANLNVLIGCWDAGSIKPAGVFFTELERLNNELTDELPRQKTPVVGVED